jgi:tetratricopeptide (TPR) repeat protein
MSNSMQRGQAAIQSKNFQEAAEWFGKAVSEQSKDPQPLACLGQTLCWLGKREEGIAQLRRAGHLLAKKARKKRDIGLLLSLTEQLQFWNDYTGALELGKLATQINDQEVRGFQLLSLTYSRLNRNQEALAAAKRASRMAPHSAMLQILVATLETDNKNHAAARQRLETVLGGFLGPEEKFRAHKELARVLDKLGAYGEVFPHLHRAGEMAATLPEVQKQDPAFVPGLIKTYEAGFDRELLGRWAELEFPPDQPAPIFLVGFLRTGTTLTQEVVGAHPKVFLADETDLIVTLRDELDRMSRLRGAMPEQLRNLDADGIRHLRAYYWAQARQRFGERIGNRLLLDKTTLNTIDLGLINCVFPDGKVIFVMRDPRDVCLSCFMQTMTPNPSTVHLFTWEGTARFYALVMHWWITIKQRLTMDFLEFRYEDAVSDFETTYRKLFDFLGLSWDPAVAEFHKRAAGRFIASPSAKQVAEPLYSSSMERWRHYQDAFSPIAAQLEPFVAAFGYRP